MIDVITDPTEALNDAAASVAGMTVEAITRWVADSVVWVLGQLTSLLNRATSPELEAQWFRDHYRVMAALAALVLLPLLFLSVISALVRQDAGQMLRSFLGYLPLAFIFTGLAITAVSLGLTATDGMTAWVAKGVGTDTATFMGNVTEPFTKVGTAGGVPLFALFIGGLIAMAGAVIVWLELLMRAAAIYVAVLFLPLALAGMVWPATAHWPKRLAHILAALVLSKFVIAAVFSLAAAGLAAGTDGAGFEGVLLGGALLLMAALCPFVLLHFAPVLEAGTVSALEGRGRRVSHAAVGGTMAMYRQASSSAGRDGNHRLPIYNGQTTPTAFGAAPLVLAGQATRTTRTTGSEIARIPSAPDGRPSAGPSGGGFLSTHGAQPAAPPGRSPDSAPNGLPVAPPPPEGKDDPHGR